MVSIAVILEFERSTLRIFPHHPKISEIISIPLPIPLPPGERRKKLELFVIAKLLSGLLNIVKFLVLPVNQYHPYQQDSMNSITF